MQSLTFLQACEDFNLKPSFIASQTCNKQAVNEMMETQEFLPIHIIKFNKFITDRLRLVEPNLKSKTFVNALTQLPEEYMTQLHQNGDEIPADVLKKVVSSMFLFATIFDVFDEIDSSEPIKSLCWVKRPIGVLGGSPLALILSGEELVYDSIFRALMRIRYGDFAAM